ncbi:MAG: hypothetical protein Q8K08_13395 [Pseudotabrizicola sp.]|nr:hypothetical protein [Pseudotabrizicola sp.]
MTAKKWNWSRDVLEVQGLDYKGPQTEQEVRGLAGFCMLRRDQKCLKELRAYVHDEWGDEKQQYYLLDFLDCTIDYTDFLLEKIDSLERRQKKSNTILLPLSIVGLLYLIAFTFRALQ